MEKKKGFMRIQIVGRIFYGIAIYVCASTILLLLFTFINRERGDNIEDASLKEEVSFTPFPISIKEYDGEENKLFYLWNDYVLYKTKNYLRYSSDNREIIDILFEYIPHTFFLLIGSVLSIFLLIPFFMLIFFVKKKIKQFIICLLSLLSIPFPIYIALLMAWYHGQTTYFEIYSWKELLLQYPYFILFLTIIIAAPTAFILYSLYKEAIKIKQEHYLIIRKLRGERLFISFFYYISPRIIFSIFRNDKIWIADLIGSVMIIEYLLNLKGIGNITIEAIKNYDYNLTFVGINSILILSLSMFLLVDIIIPILLKLFRFKY